jgi:hypothetical protein
MSEKPIGPLRQRLLDDMNMRRFVPDTQREDIRVGGQPQRRGTSLPVRRTSG